MMKKKKSLKIQETLLSQNRLGFRGLEVLQNAESQFPKRNKNDNVEKLSELIKTGEINETVSMGENY